MIPYPIPLRFQLKEEEENGVLGVLCVERERVTKMRKKRVCVSAEMSREERERRAGKKKEKNIREKREKI